MWIILTAIIFFLLSSCNIAKREKIEALYREAEQLDQVEDYKRLVNVGNEILKLDAKNIRGLLIRATGKAALGDTSGALMDVNASLAIRRTIPGLTQKSELVDSHDPETTLNLLHEAATIDSNDEYPYAHLVNYYLYLHPRKDSVRFYCDHLKKMGLRSRASLRALQNVYFSYDEPQPLFDVTDQFVKRYPDKDGYSYNNRGYALMRLGRLDEARESIAQSLVINPANSYAYRNLGLLFIEKTQPDSVCFYLNKAKEKGFTKNYGNEVDSLLTFHCRQ